MDLDSQTPPGSGSFFEVAPFEVNQDHEPGLSTVSVSSSQQLTTNVFVAGLPVDFDEVRLRALFAAYGEIFSCKIMVDIDSGVSKGFGFVRYTDAGDAAKAIEAMNGKKLNPHTPRAMYVTLAQHDGTLTLMESERVYVRNIPLHVNEHDLHKTFREFGEVLECKVLRHPSTATSTEGASKGVAFVRFRTVEEAQVAVIRAQGTRPFGTHSKPLMVRFAETHEARQHRQTRHEGPQPVEGPKGIPGHAGPVSTPTTFVWEDPSTGLVYTTSVTGSSGRIPNPHARPTMLHQSNPSLQLPPYVLAAAPQYFANQTQSQPQYAMMPMGMQAMPMGHGIMMPGMGGMFMMPPGQQQQYYGGS